MEKRTVLATVQFTFDISQKDIDDGVFGTSTTFEEALEAQKDYFIEDPASIMEIADDTHNMKWTIEYE